jgi:predicted HTH transcriptional regulator
MREGKGREEPRKRWLFLTSHGYVLLHVARRPDASAAEIAEAVGITQRQAQRVIRDLVAEGYLGRERRGVRNLYRVNAEARFRHPSFESPPLSVLIEAFAAAAAERQPGGTATGSA